MVAGEDDDVFGAALTYEAEILCDGIGGSGIPVGVEAALVRREDLHAAAERPVQIPRTAARDVIMQAVRTVLGQDHDIEDIAVDAVAQREVDDTVLAPERNGRLSTLGGQRCQSCAFAPCKDDGFYSHNEPP